MTASEAVYAGVERLAKNFKEMPAQAVMSVICASSASVAVEIMDAFLCLNVCVRRIVSKKSPTKNFRG